MRERHSPVVLLVVVLLVPALFFAGVWQSFRYYQLNQRLQTAYEHHELLFENNKRLIAGIAGLRSPQRIRQIAVRDLELHALRAEDLTRIRVGGAVE